MAEKRLARKLAAILYADVAGYSRLTGEDEEGTHRLLRRYLDLISASIPRYEGRVVHYAGDAVLADFVTVSDALVCAAAVQRELKRGNDALPEQRRVEFRIGVNLGEVIVDREEIYGDGVNVAARLEALAEPGGICVSEAVRSAVGSKLAFDFESLGEQRVKNIAEPVRAYRVVIAPDTELPAPPAAPAPAKVAKGGPPRWKPVAALGTLALAAVAALLVWLEPWVPSEEPASLERMAFPLPDKPSIAVLPFVNLSGDPSQEYFSDGLTENVITTLSKLPEMFVIARNSTFAYKGSAVKVQRVAEELGVRYVLEGSFQRAGERIRVHAQFIDALSGRHLWAERYDRDWSDVFALQDDLTRRIVASLEVKLSEEQRTRIARRYTTSVEAYDAFLRGQALFGAYDEAGAREMFERAIALDPDFARAYGALAYTYYRPLELGTAERDVEFSYERGHELAQIAVAKDPTLPQPLIVLAEITAGRDPPGALAAAKRAIELDPNFGDAYAAVAFVRTNLGEASAALELMTRALRLNPHPPAAYYYIQGRARFFAGQFAESAATFDKALEVNPGSATHRIYLAAALAKQGRTDDARWEVEQLLADEPALSVAGIAATAAQLILHEQYLMSLLEALRAAGLPEA